ncbi:MAG: hypothetical protein ACWGNV_04240 [Bacteroidales bacterium]
MGFDEQSTDIDKKQRTPFQKLVRALHYPLTQRLSLIRSLYFNLNYFPFKVAIKLPVFIYRGVKLKKMNGRIHLNFEQIEPGSIRIGKYNYGFHSRQHQTIWEQKGGTVIFGKEIRMGKGTFISVGKNACLKFGNTVNLGGNDKIICNQFITIGSNTMAAWDVQIIDTDFHRTLNTVFKTHTNAERPIVIGNHNWLGFGCTVLKGTVTPNRCIVAANTTLRSDFSNEGENIVLGQDQTAKVTAKYISFEENPTEDADEEGIFDVVVRMRNKRKAI